MKQTLKYAIVFLAGAICATAGSAYGAEAIKTISAKLRPDIKVSVNGKQLDASAISYNNTTYLPLRKAAEAVGGKIELNGKDINIVTESKPPSPVTDNGNPDSNTNSSATETSPHEGKVLYEWREIATYIREAKETFASRGVVDGNTVIAYKGIDYIPKDKIDDYYDSKNDRTYYTEDFLLQFLQKEDLLHLNKFQVRKNIISPI
ncbi:hypothetical protein B1A99_18560 [Cohnella sp. CIP 111063]|uniref:stalk domain-containing protein n=1 Tax=unclassified Cohnella TaxID=2636738 RepID=UPI000B8C1526|nr:MULTISPECIES: hypothetical protein [unclassified Cohnella]OXS56865.1 hypothetical protein B1A99_18560 [Cohnella sp. CIP 111063]PRX69702.1 hypothetical protein B0G52_11260 [Cohnella sp. SGD-V74]